MTNFSPLRTGFSRVFLIEGRARPDHQPVYESSLRAGAPSQGFGDIERIENPDPNNYGKFIEIGQVRGSTERATTSLEGRYALDLKSTLLRLAKAGCPVDLQVHMGECTDPSDFNTFTKALIFEDASLTNWGADDLGALESGDNAVVNENSDISAASVYEVMQMSLASKAASVVTNEVIDVVICGSASCGDCDDENSGCDHLYALTKSAGGSPSTPADIVFSLDKGATWYAHDIESLSTTEPSALACVGSYLVVVSNAGANLHYALLSEFDTVTDPVWTAVATGVVAGGEPNAISGFSGRAFVVGDGGYIYVTDDPTGGLTVQDAGSATPSNLNAVDALSKTFAVAVGNSGSIVLTEDGESWSRITPTVFKIGSTPISPITQTFSAVAVKNKKEWLIGSEGGRLFYTNDGGVTFSEKTFYGSGSGVVHDIDFATDSIVYMSHATTTPAGRLHRSYDGGYSWNTLPEGTGLIPANDQLNAIAACADDPNFLFAGGLGDDASDGIIIIGQ